MADWISVKEGLPEDPAEVLAVLRVRVWSGERANVATAIKCEGDRWLVADYQEGIEAYTAGTAMEDNCFWISHWMQLPTPPNTCSTCRWYAPFDGVCRNGDRERRADFVGADETCPEWQHNPTHEPTHQGSVATHGGEEDMP